VLNPTKLLFPEEERLVDSNVAFWRLCRGKLGLRVIMEWLDFMGLLMILIRIKFGVVHKMKEF
jgi:hypothetical protein